MSGRWIFLTSRPTRSRYGPRESGTNDGRGIATSLRNWPKVQLCNKAYMHYVPPLVPLKGLGSDVQVLRLIYLGRDPFQQPVRFWG